MNKTIAKKFSFKDKSLPEDVKIFMTDLIRHCPFCFERNTDLQNLPIILKGDEDGWFFTCQVCTESQCSGYLKNNPQN